MPSVFQFLFLPKGLLFLQGQLHVPERRRDVLAHKIEVDLYRLGGFDTALAVTLMDKDFLDKLIEHGVCHILKTLVFVNQRDKLFRRFLALIVAADSFFQRGNLGGKGLLHFPDERRLVRFGIVGNDLEHPRNQIKRDTLINVVLGGAKHSNGGLAVLPTGILRNALAVVGAVDVHLAAAVGTVEQVGQRRSLTVAVWVAPEIAPDTSYVVKGFLVDDSIMGILKNCPLVFIDIVTFLILEMLSGLEIDGVT